VSIYGAITCSECVAGKWGNANKTLCNQCNAGLYTSEIGAASIAVCLGCPQGRYSSVLGVSSKEKCIACALGRASEKLGTTSAKDCQACKKGTFTSDEASTTCKTCIHGTEANKEEAATGCNRCDLGRFGDIEGCHDCAVGMHQDSKGKTNCINCTQGKLYTTPQAPCTQCPTGRYGSEAGNCSDCRSGQYNNEPEQIKCKDCKADTYLIKTGATSPAECVKCSIDKSTGASEGNINAAACLCKRKDYYQDDVNCSKCPSGGDCSASDGLPLINVTAQNGYWKASQDSIKFSDCSEGYQGLNAVLLSKQRCNISNSNMNHTDDTEWSSDNQCQATYRGTLCLECIENYVRVGDDCKECQGGASLGMAFMAGAGMIVPVFIGVMVSLLCEGKTNKATSDAEKGTALVGQLKILLTFIQILSSMQTTYNGIPWRKFLIVSYSFLTLT
jgi:hypothetical protein